MPGVKQFYNRFSQLGFGLGQGGYFAPTMSGGVTSNQDHATVRCMADGEISNLKVVLASAPGAGKSRSFEFLINGVASGVIATASDAQTVCSDAVNIANVQRGDLITVLGSQTNTAAATTIEWSFEFDGIEAGEAWYAFIETLNSTALNVCPLASYAWPTSGWNRDVVRVPGTVEIDIELLTAPGVGTTRTFTPKVNGVSGTSVNISDAATTASIPPFTVAEDDQIEIVVTATGSPATSVARCSTRFTADTDGIANVCGTTTSMYTFGGVTEWAYPTGYGWTGVAEADVDGHGPLGTMVISKFRVATPNVASMTVLVRKNGADTAVAATMSGVTAADNDSDTVSIGNADTWSVQHSPVGFLAGQPVSWGWAVAASSEAEQPPTPIQRVTQLFIEIASNEDIQDDPPEPVADCTGGGEVAQGTNPEDGSALDDATTPLVWMEVTTNASPPETYYWAKASIPHGEPKEARVLEFGVRTLALSDIDGGPETATIITTLADVDGFVRGLWQSDALLGARVDYFIQDLPDLRAGLAPNRRFRGYIARCEPGADRTFRITVEDAFSAALNALDGQDLESPTQLIEDNIATLEPTEEMFDKPAPLVFGSVSSPTGAWEFKYVGESGGRYWFLASMGVVKIQEVFLGGLGLLPNDRIQLSESAFGASSYISADGKDRAAYTVAAGRRWTLLNGSTSSGAIRLAKEGTLPMIGNVCGLLEDQDGGSPNATVSSPPRALVLYINNYLLQDATGQWLPILTDNGISLLDTETFEDVHDKLEAMAGSPGASAIAGAVGGDFRQVSWRDRVAEFCRSFGFDFGINRHGQGILAVLDLLDDAAGAETFTPRHILESSVRNLSRLPVENEIRYVYAKRYVTPLPHLAPPTAARLPFDPYANDWESGLLTLRDEPSIAALGGGTRGRRRSQVQEYTLSRHAGQSADVAQRRLDLLSPPNGRIEVAFGLTLKHGADLVLGQIVNVEHWDLPWTGARRCQIRRLEEDLDGLTVSVTSRDVDDLLP